jgi:uncharacterized integral membrane protein (TIGR00698 family)
VSRHTRLLPGLLLTVAIAAVATVCARFAPIVGAPVFALLLGVALRGLTPFPDRVGPGLAFASRTVLQVAIVVSGFGLSLAVVVRTGLGTLPVTLGTIAVALIAAPVVGRMLALGSALRTLVGVGTAICGASAIAAVSSVIEPDEAEIALAIATVFFYNVVAVLVFPAIGHLLSLNQAAFGLWAGTAINDTSSVVAAGYIYGRDAGDHATIVKLTRATLILPIVAVIAFRRAREIRATGTHVPWRRIVPWFILWFLVAALVNSTGVVPAAWHDGIARTAIFLISVALAGIGAQTQLGRVLRTGSRPLALGFVLWVAVAVSSLAIQRATGL